MPVEDKKWDGRMNRVYSWVVSAAAIFSLQELKIQGPNVVARGEGFVIHAFHASMDQGNLRRAISPGIVLAHTSLLTGELKWMLRTGIYSLPTRRVSYSVERLLGLVEDKDRLIAFVYSQNRFWTPDDKPPLQPDPEYGKYRLMVFSKSLGTVLSSCDMDLGGLRPHVVPSESESSSVFEAAGMGYRVLGRTFTVDASHRCVFEKPVDK